MHCCGQALWDAQPITFLPTSLNPHRRLHMGHPYPAAAQAGVGGRAIKARASWTTRLLWLVFLLVGHAAGLVAAGDGPGGRPCALSLDAAAQAKSVQPGRTLTLTVKWSNHALAGFADGVLQLQLSPHVAFTAGSVSGRARWRGPKKPAFDPNTNTVTWARLAVPAKARLVFKVRTKVAKCYPGAPLIFKAAAFVLDPSANDPVPLCVQEDVVAVVRE